MVLISTSSEEQLRLGCFFSSLATLADVSLACVCLNARKSGKFACYGFDDASSLLVGGRIPKCMLLADREFGLHKEYAR